MTSTGIKDIRKQKALEIYEQQKQRKAIERVSFSKILALDVATKTGWAISNQVFGLLDLKIRRDESNGMKLIRFRKFLREIVDSEKIDMIAFERTAGRFKSSIIVQAELHGILKAFCEDNQIQYRAFSAKEIKSFATNNGNAGKPAMIEAARLKYGYKGNDDNEADALHILNLAKSVL